MAKLDIRIDDEELELLKHAATSKHMSLSAWVRDVTRAAAVDLERGQVWARLGMGEPLTTLPDFNLTEEELERVRATAKLMLAPSRRPDPTVLSLEASPAPAPAPAPSSIASWFQRAKGKGVVVWMEGSPSHWLGKVKSASMEYFEFEVDNTDEAWFYPYDRVRRFRFA